MALSKRKTPYEFLARWNHETGALQGAHVGFMILIEEDGALISVTPENVQSVAIGVGDKGYPLADILDQLHIDALTRIDALTTTVAEKDAAIAEKEKLVVQAEEAHAVMEAQLQQAAEDIAALTKHADALADELVKAQTPVE